MAKKVWMHGDMERDSSEPGGEGSKDLWKAKWSCTRKKLR